MFVCVVFCQAEDGIRDLVRSRGFGDVYKRQGIDLVEIEFKGHGRVVNRFEQAGRAAAIGHARVIAEALSLIHI